MTDTIRFAASYSGGKDSVLALYREIRGGHEPARLLTTYNEGVGRSWFHGVPAELLERIGESLGIPLEPVTVGPGAEYASAFEAALVGLRGLGVSACVFGDIDIPAHYEWCDARCRAAGVASRFPLWQESRRELVYEFIDAGFKGIITIVDTQRLSERFLGKVLTREVAEEIAGAGADICGENGEYHTFVWDGPLFRTPVAHRFGDILRSGAYAILPLFAV